MIKNFFLILLFLLLSVTVVVAIEEHYKTVFDFPRRYGVQHITHFDPRVVGDNYFARIDSIVYLNPVDESDENYGGEGAGRGGYVPIYPRATAKIQSSRSYGGPNSIVTISTKDLKASDRVYGEFESWLVDDDTGYWLYTGSFTVGFGGYGQLRYMARNYLNAYDRVVITFKPFESTSILPGEPILSGDIQKRDLFNPLPKQAKMVGGTFS